jgi:hypothetical protein
MTIGQRGHGLILATTNCSNLSLSGTSRYRGKLSGQREPDSRGLAHALHTPPAAHATRPMARTQEVAGPSPVMTWKKGLPSTRHYRHWPRGGQRRGPPFYRPAVPQGRPRRHTPRRVIAKGLVSVAQTQRHSSAVSLSVHRREPRCSEHRAVNTARYGKTARSAVTAQSG